MAGLEGLLGNNTLAQIVAYNVIGQLLMPLLAPYTQALLNETQGQNPEVPLTPADFALAVIRNIRPLADAAAQARKSGINDADFQTLVALTGDAPAAGDMAQALRRGFVDEATFERGVREGRLRDEWIPLVKQLATSDPTPTLALQSLLQGQTDAATAKTLFQRFGGNPDYFDLAYNTEGSSPSPIEAGVMAHRGIIPWTGSGAGAVSFEQAFLEGPWRNKWLEPMRQLTTYLPPPRTVTAMVREGAITPDQATKLFEDAGLSPELAAAYLHAASTTKTAHHRELSESMIVAAYTDHLMTAADATTQLEAIGYTAAEVDLIIKLADFRINDRMARGVISRMHNLYVAHKITRSTAETALSGAKVPTENVSAMMTLWDIERADNHKVLTAGEIAGAVFYGILDPGEGATLLGNLGYSPFEAWLIMSVRSKGPVGSRPGMDPVADSAGG